MDWHEKLQWFRKGSLLPTTFKPESKQNLGGYSDGLFARQNHVLSSSNKFSSRGNDIVSVRRPSNNLPSLPKELVSVFFPSYLNNGGCKSRQSGPNQRKSSLLDGLEQTLYLMETNEHQAKLVLPKHSKKRYNVNNEPHENANLPVSIVPLRKFKKTGTLYGYLDDQFLRRDFDHQSTKTSIIAIILIFLCSIAVIMTVYKNFPEMDADEAQMVKLPQNIEDAKALGRVLSKYKDTNYYEVMFAFFITYIFLQTFAIPGSIFLSILSGFLYPFYIALFLVCLCSGIGATGCYMISYFVGKPLVKKYLSERVRKWNLMVDEQREHLFNYLLFLRITPFLPNWFINIVSPIIHIPVSLFFFATFIGVAPLSFIAIQGGTTLYQLTKAGDALSWSGVAIMAVLAVLSLLPVALKRVLKNKYE